MVFIDHDLIIRHFIKSGAFAELERRFDVIYVFNDDTETDKKWIFTDVDSLGLSDVRMTTIPRSRMGSWYRLYAITVLHNQRGTANFRGRKELVAETIGWLRTRAYSALSRPGVYQLIRRILLSRQGEYPPLARLIEAERPDLVIQPSILTGYYINELLLITRRLAIPYVVLMNSWDNPSQKAVTTGQPDRLVVWGEQTRRHAIEYMRMPADRVEVFGAAQFQVYRSARVGSDADLRREFKVPADGPVILYAGVSKSINETRHLKLLDEAIASGAIPRCHILYRPHPWRGGLVEGEEDFFSVQFRHVSMDPFMEPYYRRVTHDPSNAFDMADYAVTARLMRLIDGTISSLSTVLIETLIHGRPTVSFVPRADIETRYSRANVISLRLAHFADLWGRPGVIECHDDADLAQSVSQLLTEATDPARRDAIRDASRYFVEMNGPSYAERLADLAENLVKAA